MCLAIPTHIKTIDENGIAIVELGGVERQISLIMTPDAKLGDYVLVHTGYAISLMDPEEAQASLEAFAELAVIQAEMEAEEAARMGTPSGAGEPQGSPAS
jgi:hydrogenase expression/formation protein HypC